MKVSKRQTSLELLRNALLLGAVFTVGSALVSTSAYAQSTPPASPPPAEEAEKKADEKVVVTGSRIKRSEFTSPNPIQVITNEQSVLRGQIDAADVLQQGTLAAGAQQINNTLTGFVANGGPGVNTLSLRGLGATRTLVMLNGRRLSPAGTRGAVGAVDLNVLPQTVINRFEILKDGASSIYGSDAVAGVINAITIRNFDGVSIDASGILPFEGGAEEARLGVTWGERFDNGNFSISAEYFNREALEVGDRDYLSCQQDLVMNATTDPASVFSNSRGQLLDIIDPATGKSKCFNIGFYNAIIGITGVAGTYQLEPTAVAGGGIYGLDQPGLRRVGAPVGTVATSPVGALLSNQGKIDLWKQGLALLPTDAPALKSRTFISPVERMSVFAQGDVQISNDIQAYGEFLFNRRESSQQGFSQFFPVINAANPNNPFRLGGPNQIGAVGRAAQPVILYDNSEAGELAQTVDFYRAVGGLKGDLFSLSDYFMRDWSFDIYMQGTLSDASYSGTFIYNDRVVATTGAVACNQAAITISGGNCADVPTGINYLTSAVLASNGSVLGFTPQERAFLFGYETGTTRYEQFLVSGTVSGTLFDLPAGEVGAVLGFEKRYDSLDDTPGFNARNQNYWGQTTGDRTTGSDSVIEGFGELEIPLLADLDLVKALTVNLSTRFTNYDSYGSESTYKMGFDYRMTDEYRLRGTVGTSFRAPALFELFLKNQTGFLNRNAIDTCAGNWSASADPNIVANCGALGLPDPYNPGGAATIITGGGAGVLDPETSEAKTIGFIWTPDWLPIRAAVDYWDFVIDDGVGTFTAAGIVNQCVTSPGFSSPFCALIARDAAGEITTVNSTYVNIAKQEAQGIDVAFQFREEYDFGTITFDFQGTWAFDQFLESIPGDGDDFNGEIFGTDFVGNVDLRYDEGPWTVNWNLNMLSRSSQDEDLGATLFGYRGNRLCGTGGTAFQLATCVHGYYKQYTEFHATHDLSVRWRDDGWTMQVGVVNVFDEHPPTISTGLTNLKVGNAVATGSYDVVGRRLFVNLGYSF